MESFLFHHTCTDYILVKELPMSWGLNLKTSISFSMYRSMSFDSYLLSRLCLELSEQVTVLGTAGEVNTYERQFLSSPGLFLKTEDQIGQVR